MDSSAAQETDITALAVRVLTLYSLAEFQSGHASAIRVTAERTSFGVEDDGRGHAFDRMVDGSPYRQFVYTHLAYPFANHGGGPVQLQGLGLSLLNTFCSELGVTVRKKDEALHMSVRSGRLCGEERMALQSQTTGNTVSGVVNPNLQRLDTNCEAIERWLADILSNHPALKLHFNGVELLVNNGHAATA